MTAYKSESDLDAHSRVQGVQVVHIARAGYTLCGTHITDMRQGDAWIGERELDGETKPGNLCMLCDVSRRTRASEHVASPDGTAGGERVGEPAQHDDPAALAATVSVRRDVDDIVFRVAIPMEAIAGLPPQALAALSAPGTPAEKLERLAALLRRFEA